MNCQNFEAVVTELAREQMMEANVREEALVHLNDCTSCANRYEEEQSLTDSLRALSHSMRTLAPNDGIESRLLTEFRNQRVTAISNVRARRSYWVYAAAAVLLIVFGVTAYRIVTSSKQQQLAVTQNQGPVTTTPTQ